MSCAGVRHDAALGVAVGEGCGAVHAEVAAARCGRGCRPGRGTDAWLADICDSQYVSFLAVSWLAPGY